MLRIRGKAAPCQTRHLNYKQHGEQKLSRDKWLVYLQPFINNNNLFQLLQGSFSLFLLLKIVQNVTIFLFLLLFVFT